LPDIVVSGMPSRLPQPLQHQFSAEHPNEKWVADLPCVDTEEGQLYLALGLDIFSHKIVGWAMDQGSQAK
jgi:putative transposase